MCKYNMCGYKQKYMERKVTMVKGSGNSLYCCGEASLTPCGRQNSGPLKVFTFSSPGCVNMLGYMAKSLTLLMELWL